MRLIPISEHPDAAQVLYDLLTERPKSACISHKAMPTWEEHLAFIASEPYEAWYLVIGPYLVDDQGNMIKDGPAIGSIYLTRQNEIGVAILGRYLIAPVGHGAGRNAVRLLMEKHGSRRYIANVAPTNEPSRKMFEKLGFRTIQHTMALDAD